MLKCVKKNKNNEWSEKIISKTVSYWIIIPPLDFCCHFILKPQRWLVMKNKQGDQSSNFGSDRVSFYTNAKGMKTLFLSTSCYGKIVGQIRVVLVQKEDNTVFKTSCDKFYFQVRSGYKLPQKTGKENGRLQISSSRERIYLVRMLQNT